MSTPSASLRQRAVRERWNVKVDSCSMNPSTFEVATRHDRILDYCLNGLHNQTVEVLLSSSIDAVGANAPTRVLTKDSVGALPVTGSISNR